MFFQSLSIAVEKAIEISKNHRGWWAIMQRTDTNEYYVAGNAENVRCIDKWVAQYEAGELCIDSCEEL